MFRLIANILLLTALLLSACSPALTDHVTLTEKDAGRRVELRLDQTLAVTLKGNPTTGNNWEPENKNLKTLQRVGLPEFRPASSQPGSPGTVTLRFTPIAAGQEPLKLIYHRSWETGVEPLNTFEVTVVVK